MVTMSRAKHHFTVAALAVTFASVPASSSRFLDNPDIVVDRSVETRLAPIGELESVATVTDGKGNLGNRRGTGFIVSPCFLMTAAHVVFGDEPVTRAVSVHSDHIRTS